MANLGNAWHIPTNPEPRGRGGMRDPVGAIVPGTAVAIVSGNQFQGAGGNPGNQLQDGSSVFFKRSVDGAWTEAPMKFQVQADNNKFYAATIAPAGLRTGDVIQYYLRLPYSDHDTTFLRAEGAASAATADENAARAAPFAFTVESSAVRGAWGPVFALPNVAIHAHLLPNGLVLFWGRRDGLNDSIDVHACTPQLWNPLTRQVTPTPQPKLADGTTINLFCSGHSFLPDGRLLVVGGHLFDSQGLNQACIYDPDAKTWTPTSLMNNGRWYPTATTLPDGSVLVSSGSFLAPGGATPNNQVPQVWSNGPWTSIATLPNGATFELYPRMHLTSRGEVFMSGPLAQTWLLTPTNGGRWRTVARRAQARRDYAASVMYAPDKVLYTGGGNDRATQQPTAAAEIIDLRAATPAWQPTSPMRFRRRQHNATVLADGTVLVTGGTRGGGGPDNPPGFNDLGAGQPVHTAELWDPQTGRWSTLAAESVDRCYHATAVLLPDATVLSAGGGEYRPTPQPAPNDPADSHRDGQIFSPPYLFKGPRPVIASAPASVSHGETFEVATDQSADIAKVTFIGLSSVTHSCNMGQHFNVLVFRPKPGGLTVTAPASPEQCPPGPYLLFVLSRQGVPSVAATVRMNLSVELTEGISSASMTALEAGIAAAAPMDAFEARAAVVAETDWSPVVVGLLGTCPYGIGACWGGAHEALATLERVRAVDPIPDADNSTANVYLEDDRLPPLRRWEDQFGRVVNGSYTLRGVEVTVEGTVAAQSGELFLDSGAQRPRISLRPLGWLNKIQWNNATASPQVPEPQEANAYQRLAAALSVSANRRVTVTGPLKETDSGYLLEVRVFSV